MLSTAVLILAVGLAPDALWAQYMTPPPPASYGIENVTLVSPDGTRNDSLTLVVRNGLIEVLAAGAALPEDARVLEGDSLFLYPGLVDAHGAATVTWPDPRDMDDDDDVRSWDPPRSRQGFTPHRRVADHLAATGAELGSARTSGIVASLIHPSGGMAAGQPAVLLHREAATPWELVHEDDPGLAMSLQSAGGVYPSQLFGVLAFLRQAFLDAERYEVMRTSTAAGEGGFMPPGWDPDYEALRRAARGEVPVFFQANSDEDIRRGLDLADEVGFRPVLVGGEEAWKLADELARRDVPVLVSLDFPRLDEWDPEADTVPAELEPAAAREKDRIENVWANPGRLEAAGVTFALTTGGGEADLLEGLRKVVEHGLTEAAAVRAVTTTPAELLGVGALVRVREGGPATFVVAAGDLLNEDTEVAYTFVEGRLTEGAAVGGGADGGEPAGDLTGTWRGDIAVGGQDVSFSLELTQAEDGSLTGTMSASEMPTSPVSGQISGTSITIEIEAEGMPEPIRLTGTLDEDGNRMTGGGSTSFGEMTFEATRDPGAGWAAWLGGGR
jgi:imidazolonepropionase-like amidohydrolase